MNISGFSFRPLCQVVEDGIPGLQFGFWNNYGVSIIPDSYSDDERFEHATVSVVIFRGEHLEESEDATIDIMEKMGHRPTVRDMRAVMFTKVSPEYLLKILHTVAQMELQ